MTNHEIAKQGMELYRQYIQELNTRHVIANDLWGWREYWKANKTW